MRRPEFDELRFRLGTQPSEIPAELAALHISPAFKAVARVGQPGLPATATGSPGEIYGRRCSCHPGARSASRPVALVRGQVAGDSALDVR